MFTFCGLLFLVELHVTLDTFMLLDSTEFLVESGYLSWVREGLPLISMVLFWSREACAGKSTDTLVCALRASLAFRRRP